MDNATRQATLARCHGEIPIVSEEIIGIGQHPVNVAGGAVKSVNLAVSVIYCEKL